MAVFDFDILELVSNLGVLISAIADGSSAVENPRRGTSSTRVRLLSFRRWAELC
jgi:hypothetical protein